MDKLYKFSNEDYYTMLRIRELLYELYKSYHNLEDSLDFHHVLEYFSLYIFMYRFGFLSVNKKFEFSMEERTKYDPMDRTGYIIITGYGVCRDISRLFCDILQSRGLHAADLIVRYPSILDYELLNLEKPSIFHESRKNCITGCINYASSDEIKKRFKEDREKLTDEEYEHKSFKVVLGKPVPKEAQYLGNHEICYVRDGKSIYYLDPTNSKVLLRKGNYFIEADIKTKLMKLGSLIYVLNFVSDKELGDILRAFVPHNSESSKDFVKNSRSLTENAIKVCNDNIDLLEKFYQDNKELYSEINAYAQFMRKRQ